MPPRRVQALCGACLVAVTLAAVARPALAVAQAPKSASPSTSPARPLPPLAEKIAALTSDSGLLRIYRDAAAGRVWLRLPPPRGDGVVGTYLYVSGLAGGVGSNRIGLDRGLMGPTRVVTIRVVGRRVLIEQQNTRREVDQSRGFKKELELFSQMKPKQSLEFLKAKQPEDAAHLLLEMPTRSAKKIIESAKTPDDRQTMTEILRLMGEVAPQELKDAIAQKP